MIFHKNIGNIIADYIYAYMQGLSRKYPSMYDEKETFIEKDTRYKKHFT